MLKKVLALLALLFTASSFAGGGFLWMQNLEHALHIKEHVLTFAMIAFAVVILGVVYRAKLAAAGNIVIPDNGISFRNIVEAYGEWMYGLTKSTIGEENAKKYFGVFATLFIFIFLNNSIGLIPGFLPPTENLNTTLALGLFVFIYYNYQGIKEQGIVGHIKHFMGPVWYLAILIFPIEIISHFVRPLSLGLRLRGNMSGDHMVLSIFSDLVPLFVPIVFLGIGLFVCFMQAFVFTLLSMVYVGLATEHHDHDDHH